MLAVLCTNDFAGQWDPSATSYGRLPGAAGLVRTIEGLKRMGPAVWIDAGDLVVGSIAGASGGTAGFEAATALPIDLAVPGNHEFDWGLEHFQQHARRLPYPWLCGNVDAGLPATALLPTDAGPLGVIGLTCTDLGAIHFVPNSLVGPPLDDRVRAWAGELRADGARWVILVLHDGVDLVPAPAGLPSSLGVPGLNIDVRRLHRIVKPWLLHIDGLVCGHTLNRWFGDLDGVPVAQPLVHGAEVGVLALRKDGRGMAFGVPVEPGGVWEGPGGDLLRDLSARRVGDLVRPLTMKVNRRSSLLESVGRSILRASGADAALTTIWDVGCIRQPLVGGVGAHWPAGPFSELDLLNLLPFPEDRIAIVELSPRELQRLPGLSSLPHLIADGVVIGSGVDIESRPALNVAVRAASVERMSCWLGRSLDHEATDLGMRDVVAHDIREGEFTAG